MKRFTPKKTALLLGCVMLAVAGCHRNQSPQSAQNTAAQSSTPNAQSQSAAQPTANPDNGAAAAPGPTTAQPAVSNAAPASTPAGAQAPANGSAAPPPPPDAQQANVAPQQPAPVVVPEGTTLRIRLNQHISVKTSHAGDVFDGTIVDPVMVNGAEVIPAGSPTQGRVVEAHRRGRFKGRSLLELRLVGVDVNGRHYRLDTSTVARTKKGKGKRTAAFIGGGAGLGMLIGGIATGGAGLVIGGLSGAGAGTLGAAFTGNRDIDIPAETVMSFRLAQPVELR